MALIEIVPVQQPVKVSEEVFKAMTPRERLFYARQWDQRQFAPKPEPRIIPSRRR